MILLKRGFAAGAFPLLLLWPPTLLCAQNGGSISGLVTNSVTGAGIAGAKFRVCPYSGAMHCGNTNYRAIADTAGSFHIGGIPDGRYIVFQLEADGFRSTDTPPPFSVSGDSRLDLQMAPFAKISGRVFDPEGKPATGVAVKLGNGLS